MVERILNVTYVRCVFIGLNSLLLLENSALLIPHSIAAGMDALYCYFHKLQGHYSNQNLFLVFSSYLLLLLNRSLLNSKQSTVNKSPKTSVCILDSYFKFISEQLL